ncbi:hypothetical protein Tco_1487927, partial [Tanacetum coccineum]
MLPFYPHHLLLLHHHLSFHLHLLLPHPGFVDDELFLSDPGRTFSLVDFTVLIVAFYFGSFLIGHASPDTTVDGSSTPLRFVYPSLARTPRCSKAYLRWRSAPLSTMYPLTTFESSTRDSCFESSVGPSRKRCRSPSATVTSYIHATRALVHSRVDLFPPRKRTLADATAVKVAVDKDVVTGVDAGIDMEVDVGVDVEDEVEDEVESSDKEQVEEGLQDIYEHVMEIALERTKDIETGHRELEARSLIAGGERASLLEQVASLERSNARLRGTMMMERARANRLIVEPVDSSSISVNQVPHYRLNNMTITRFGMTPEAIKELVNQRVEEVLAAYEETCAANALEDESQSQNGSDGNNGNGGNGNGGDGNGRDGNGHGRNGNPNENNMGARPVARECTYQDFMKCQPLNCKGTEGVFGL